MKKRILYAEDDAVIRMLVSTALMQHGFSVEAVGDGKAALERIAGEPFDLVLTDNTMPEMTGAELVAALRERLPQQIIVMISGEYELATTPGLSGFIRKPVDFNECIALLERLTASVH